MSHEFTYPRVTEIRRLSLEIAPPPIRPGTTATQPASAPGAVKRP
jgi:hypothetical protein